MGRQLLAVIQHLETGHLTVARVLGACAISTGLAPPLLTPYPTDQELCTYSALDMYISFFSSH